jgi:ERCC4-related helicase
MGCFTELHPARVYHVPKDDLADALTSSLIANAVLVRRSTGDVSSTALWLHRTALAKALEANPEFRLLWLTGNRIGREDAQVLRDLPSYVFPDLLEALRDGPAPNREAGWCRRVMATLLRDGVLDWRVVIPEARGVYHEKGLVAKDACGHLMLLTGSWNETGAGYERNVERIDVHKDWEDPERCREAAEWFDRVWDGREGGMAVMAVEDALRNDLLVLRREEPWRPLVRGQPDPAKWTPELLYLAIQDKVPWTLKDPYVGTLVRPLPHQVHVHRRVLSRPPARFLLADEVGLGKTIEAGLILSTLVATGLARRVLVLAPAHVLPQWDDELREKFRLDPWTLRGKYWVNESRKQRIRTSDRLFSRLPGSPPHILLVSQAIASRRTRRKDFEFSSWDLVIVDEAHHARGRQEGPLYRKNNLLRTLDSLALRTASLLLMTATPVQLGLNELFDLLHPLGLPSGWTEREDFERFLSQLDDENPDWGSAFEMAQTAAEYYRELHGLSREDFERDLASGVQYFQKLSDAEDPESIFRRLVEIVESRAIHDVPTLPEGHKHLLKIVLYRMSPMYQLICRNTRNLLRQYARKGVAKIQIPTRQLHDPIAIHFTEEEASLYRAIEEEYVKPFYRDYAQAGLPTHGVGFILTIYRKRAASSWAALRKSLARRWDRLDNALREWGDASLRRLFGSLSVTDLVSSDAGEGDREVELEGQEERLDDLRFKGLDRTAIKQVVERERAKVRELLERLESLESEDTDSKRDALIDHLARSLQERRGTIVFSQYKDTVDALSDVLYREFGASLAKYHGDGGEIWDRGQWKLVSKERVEGMVQAGSLSVLMATDAASEGLNLQAMDEVVNYDLPWNPMRIEQRIGRIDRITQKSPSIRIGVLVPEETIEMDVYERCVQRLGLFRQAMGPLQPVLVENYVTDVVLKGEDPDRRWVKVEKEWETAQEHARLFEEALSAQDLRAKWAERKAAEVHALGRLLDGVGYAKEGDVWVRAGHRIVVEGTREDAERMTAVPHDPLFLTLLPELGAPPPTLPWNGLEYRVLDTDGSKVLAVKHPDGAIYIVRDLSDVEARNEMQVGRDWQDARRFALRLEQERRRTYRKFMERQREIRADEWKRDAEEGVLGPLTRWADGDIDKAVDALLGNPPLRDLGRCYLRLENDPTRYEVRPLLARLSAGRRRRGRKPRLDGIVERAKGLLLRGIEH